MHPSPPVVSNHRSVLHLSAFRSLVLRWSVFRHFGFPVVAGVLAMPFSISIATAQTDAKMVGSDCTTDIVRAGSNAIYAWSLNLDGKACRRWNRDGTTVRVDVDINRGGYDAGVARNEMPTRLSGSFDAPPLRARLDVDLRGEGTWWAGPKICVCQTRDWKGLDGNYECYIVEDAKKSPEALAEFFGNHYRGQSVVDGAVYKHYTRPWEGWQQIIAIRQTYRQTGPMNYGEILRYWHDELDLPDWYLHNPKVGLETWNENRGHFQWSDIETSRPR